MQYESSLQLEGSSNQSCVSSPYTVTNKSSRTKDMESPVVAKKGNSSTSLQTNYDEELRLAGSGIAAQQSLRRRTKSPTALRKRNSNNSTMEDTSARATQTHSTEPPQLQRHVTDPVLPRKSSSIASPERTILTPQTSATKLKSAAAWKSAPSGLKNETSPHRRRSLGPMSDHQNVEGDHKKTEHTSNQRASIIEVFNESYPIVRQSSDSELKRKAKKRQSSIKTTPSRKNGLSLDEYLVPGNESSNENSGPLLPYDDDDTVHTDPLSGMKRTEPRRALRSQRKSALVKNNEGSVVARVRSRSRSIPRRPSSRERKRADLERAEAMKFLTATTSSSSFIDSMTSSFSSTNSGSLRGGGADDSLEQVSTHTNDKNNTIRSLFQVRLQEAEGRNDDLAKKVEDLENKLVQAQAENEVAYAKNRRSKIEHDRLLADKDKEIRELSDILARSLDAELPKAKEDSRSGGMSVIEIRLQNELREARAKIATLEKSLSDAREQNAHLQTEVRCYQSCDSRKYTTLRAAEAEC